MPDLPSDRRKRDALRQYRVVGSETGPALDGLLGATAETLDGADCLLVLSDDRGPRPLALTTMDTVVTGRLEALAAALPPVADGGCIQLDLPPASSDEAAHTPVLAAPLLTEDGITIGVLLVRGHRRWSARDRRRIATSATAARTVIDLGRTAANALEAVDQLAAHDAELTHQSSILEHQAEELVRLAEDNYVQCLSAEGAFQQKSLFLATMTHELRTPLTAIIGFAEVMEQQMLGPVGNDTYLGYLNAIHGSGRHLLSIINDLLDMAKIEAGKYDVAPEAMDANPVLSQTIRVVGGLAIEKQVRVIWEPVRPSPQVIADDRALKQVMLNLLSNAIKYATAGGTVQVSNHVASGRFVVAIRDDGPGISPEDLRRLMRPYEQAHSQARTDTAPRGTGLGLTISRLLVELQGGSLSLDSQPGQGTTARFDLPLAGS
ncbi:hypothetical protein GCM10011505_20700 [Tistrella bauzanensis]|uniref:histidine kinase n=2 Tax=Tistrella bauzanensis TaxID=657419 RepID=A0ABQ1II40_9PROT|nr:HAMP domain-containing sensor histidine kinase [Tistrella bauzanensis]GGB39004.1 hypothetical protein GCM10011505_20700 [Tistrella bauzanensis]